MRVTTNRIRLAVAAALAFAVAAPVAAQQGPATRPSAAPGPSVPEASPPRISFATDPMMECHFYLKTWSGDSFKPGPGSGADLSSNGGAYSQASGMITDLEVWRWFEERVAESPDPAALRKAAETLPPNLRSVQNTTAVKMLVDSIESAYPKFTQAVWPRHQRSINRTLVGVRRRFIRSEDRIAKALMEKMAFSPIDAPITIITVLRSGGVTAWGKTSKGYFTVVGVSGQSPNSLLEMGVHEATHILQALQPFNTSSVLKQVRERLGRKAPAETDAFLHGLVAYNAGAMIRRFVTPSYIPQGVRDPGHEREYRPFLSTYEHIWTDYLDGRMNREQIIAKLVEEFDAILELEKGKKKEPASSS